MSESTPFSADQPIVAPEPTIQQPVIPTELQEIIGDGKKYRSVDDALKSVPHAQQHISTLEAENAQLKEELIKRRTAEDLLQDIQRGITQPGNTTPKVDLSQDVVSEIVKQEIQKREQQNIVQTNIEEVRQVFAKQFGEKAEEEYIKLAQVNNIPIAHLNQLASTSPSALFKLAGLVKQPTQIGKTTSDVNTIALSQNIQTERPSIKVRPGATTKDIMAAWNAAGDLVKEKLNKG